MKKTKPNKSEQIFKKYLDKLNNLDSEEQEKFKAYLYVIFSLITLSFFGIFAIRPTITTIASLNQQYADNQQLYQQLLTKSEALKSLEIQYDELTPNLPLIYAAIPRTTQMAYLTAQIQQMAAQNNLDLIQLTFGPVEVYPANKENPSLYSFTFNAVLEGDDTEVKNFVREMINFDRLVNIEQFNTGTRESGNYGITLTGKAYFSKY